MATKWLFIEKYQQIKQFLQTPSHQRTYEELIDIRNILEGFPLFLQFTNTKSQEFIEMCRYLEFESYQNPQMLFEQGDIADKFYVILKGDAKIFVKVPGMEQPKQVGDSSIGDSFGELALLFNSERNATIWVNPDTELMVLHRDDFMKYMKYKSTEYASQAYNLVNVIEPFNALQFPDKIRLASKMDYKIHPSNHTFITQGAMLSHFYFVEQGSIKLYRNINFNVNRNGHICFTTKFDPNKPTKLLKIEIDELGPGRFIGEFELHHYKPSQYTAVTNMQSAIFTISAIDFNLMSQFQLSEVCKNSRPYPTDEDIRDQFLSGVQWKVFKKQLVHKVNLEKKGCANLRDPFSTSKLQYTQDLKKFALNTLSFDRMMESYLDGYGFTQEEQQQPLSEFRTTKKEKPFFSNVEEGLLKLRQSQEKVGNRKMILPKIKPKVGSDIYNILIMK